MIKIITGIRRCGKSFLLFNLYKQNLLARGVPEDHVIEVNLENRLNRKLRNPDTLLEHIYGRIIDSDKYFVLLDDVQMVPEFEDVLNSFLDKENVDVYVTGSNSKMPSKDVVTEFRDMGDEIHVCPLTFDEFYAAYQWEKRHAWRDLLTMTIC
ncbi:MAG: AAA family ATPase [Bacteroidales bacterium]|nr:AAA family ATPase [Bacteroidales bacterium]